MKSIISNERVCFICGSPFNLHKHHIFGGANRRLSEQDGLWVYLTGHYHNLSNEGVHFNKELDLQLKQLAQQKYEETHTREEFMQRYGRNYL